MENLTQTYGVVKPNVPSAPMEGYKVVVLEETLGGTKFKTILSRGDRPIKTKKRLFSPLPIYSCYAVSSDVNLNFEFSAEMKLAAQHQHFTLNCTVYYYVSDAEPMALAFKTDPIKRTREEIKRRFQRNILESKIKIQDIQNEFYKVKDKIFTDITFNQLLEFSAKFGIIIKEIDMTYNVPEIYVLPGRKKQEYELKKETAFIEEEERRKRQEEEKDNLIHTHEVDEMKTRHSQKMEDLKSIHGFQRKMLDMTADGISKTVEKINSPESLEKTANSAIAVIKRAAGEIQNPDQTFSEKQLAPTTAQMKSLMAESSDSLEEAKSFLLKILAKVENSASQPLERKALLSCITHLSGEIQLEGKANPEIIEKYSNQLNKYAVKYGKIFTRSEMKQISQFKEKCNDLITQASSASDQPDNPKTSDAVDTPAPSTASEPSGVTGNPDNSANSDTSTTSDNPGASGASDTADTSCSSDSSEAEDK